MILRRSFLVCTIIIFNAIVSPSDAIDGSNGSLNLVAKSTKRKALPKRKNVAVKKKCKGKSSRRTLNTNNEYEEYIKIEGLAGITGKVSKGTKAPTSKGIKSPSSPSKGKLKAPSSPSKGKLKAPSTSTGTDCEDYFYPSASPSTSMMPSAYPSDSPSDHPTISVQPSTKPVVAPSDTPSSSPSVKPSPAPTGVPSNNPSSAPESSPSVSPSISHMPSSSMEPSASPIPTPSPSSAFSPWCDSLNNGDIAPPPQTSYQIERTYVYEMLYQNSANITEVLQNLDQRILRDLINDHVWCGNNRRSRSLSLAFLKPGHIVGLEIRTNRLSRAEQHSRSLLIDGISLGGKDSLNSNSCTNLTSSTSATTCEVYDGSYTLYLRNSSELSTGEAIENVLETIRTGMNSGSLAEGDDDIEGLHYHGETMLNDSSKNFGDNSAGSVIQPIASASLSGVGISLITVGSVIALLFVFAASRRKESYRTRRMEEIVEEDQLLFAKGGIGLDEFENDTDLMSNYSGRRDKGVIILGDENGEYTDHPPNLHIYGHGTPGSTLCDRGECMNVHKCTSATCEICSDRIASPTFVKSIYPDTAGMRHAKRKYFSPDTIEL